MLHVIDNYYAQTNNYGYSVLRDTGKQNPKTGVRSNSAWQIWKPENRCRGFYRM